MTNDFLSSYSHQKEKLKKLVKFNFKLKFQIFISYNINIMVFLFNNALSMINTPDACT